MKWWAVDGSRCWTWAKRPFILLILKATREFNREWLVSGDLLRQVKLPEGVRAECLGRIILKTNEQPVEVFALPLFLEHLPAGNKDSQYPGARIEFDTNQAILGTLSGR